MNNPIRVALAGNPNCGKTALFNALTGSHQKVGNYPGVTVEKVEGEAKIPSSATVRILDLPGTYSLDARTPDETVTRNLLLGTQQGEQRPDVLIAVVDANQLERNLAFVLELKKLELPLVVALNMMDLARKRGFEVDLEALSRELDVPVVPTVAVRREGLELLLTEIERAVTITQGRRQMPWEKPTPAEIAARYAEVDRILKFAIRRPGLPAVWTDRIDRVVLHPLWGSLLLLVVLGILFQTIFTWAQTPMDWIDGGVVALGSWIQSWMPDGALRSLLIDGIIGGVGSVVVFLPQILLLFAFMLMLEDSGYMARAAFLMDRLMGKVGLHGRAFIPLLSSFACTVPGIMATRTIENRRDRLITILISPLITCSARLPVYSLLIAAFIPNRPIWGPIRLQGLTMFLLYLAGIISALGVAVILRKTTFRGPTPPLLLELPTYKRPSLHNILHGLVDKASAFLKRAGTVILGLSILLWFLASYPTPPATNTGSNAQPAITYSIAGRIGKTLEPLVAPIGFNWQIAIAMIPGFAAREIMVGALATVYSVENKDEAAKGLLARKIGTEWSLATGISLLVWYIFSCQCVSTLAITRRETLSWKWPGIMFLYMTVLAYVMSFITYQVIK